MDGYLLLFLLASVLVLIVADIVISDYIARHAIRTHFRKRLFIICILCEATAITIGLILIGDLVVNKPTTIDGGYTLPAIYKTNTQVAKYRAATETARAVASSTPTLYPLFETSTRDVGYPATTQTAFARTHSLTPTLSPVLETNTRVAEYLAATQTAKTVASSIAP